MKNVRKGFFESIVDGTSLETVSSISQRILNLEKFLKNQNEGNAIIITHGWLMRFLYSYFVLQRNIHEIGVEEYLSYPIFGHLDLFTVDL